jgi:hypothetical protein
LEHERVGRGVDVANIIAPVMDGTPTWTDDEDVEHGLAFMDEPDEIVVFP